MRIMSPESPHVHTGQAGPIAVRPRPADPPPRKSPGGKPWIERIPSGVYKFGPRKFYMLYILEDYCRSKAYCWASNEALIKAYGSKKGAENTIRNLLREMEDDKIILRIPPEKGKKGRVGIILFERLDPDLPVADPEDPGPTIDLLKGTRETRRLSKGGQQILPLSGPQSGQKNAGDTRRKLPVSHPQKTAARIKTQSLSFEEGRIEVGPPNPRGELISLSTNDNDPDPDADPAPQAPVTGPAEAEPDPPPAPRPVDLAELPPPPAMILGLAEVMARPDERPADPPRPPIARPLPPPRPRVIPAAPPREAPGLEALTPGQADWLASLPVEKRATFDGLSPGRKAMVLGRRPQGVCTDPMLLRMEEADLAPRRPVAIPPPVLTIEDAVGAIVGGHRPATAMLATLLAREFDDQKSWPFFDQIGGHLMADPARADGFLDALRQARGPKAVNPGAVLVKALRRDHGWEFKTP